MGSSLFRKYPYPNPTGDGADVSYWAQRLADALDADMNTTLGKITAAVATGAANAGKIATNVAAITSLKNRATALEGRNASITTNTTNIAGLTTRTTALEGRNSTINTNTVNIASNLTKIISWANRVLALEARTPFIMHAGTTIVTLPIGFAGNNVWVTFPGGGFDVPPIMAVGMEANASGDAAKVIPRFYDVTKSSVRIDIGTTDNKPSTSLYSFKIHWQAVQMNTGSANG